MADPDPIREALAIAEELLAAGRKADALSVLDKANDAIEARIIEATRERTLA